MAVMGLVVATAIAVAPVRLDAFAGRLVRVLDVGAFAGHVDDDGGTAGAVGAGALGATLCELRIDLGQNVKVKAVRSTIGDVIPPGSSAPAID